MSFNRLGYGLAGAALVLGLATCGSDSDLDSSIKVHVFADWHGDGIQSMDEGGVEAVEVRIAGDSSETTAQGGEAQFEVVEGSIRLASDTSHRISA